jgi:RHS repeat-associated protein
VWCGTELCEQRNLTGATVTKRFFGQGEQIFGINYYFTSDHLGSIREMTDGTGTIQARYDYDPYGRRTKLSGSLDADFGFTGHFTLASQPDHTLTMYRLYRPDLGRWTSKYPLAEKDGLNLYKYVGNNPINSFDELGLLTCNEIAAILAKAKLEYRAALDSAIDAQNALTEIEKASVLQGYLITSSAILSTGNIALGGSRLIGFSGFGTTASIVGRGTFTVTSSVGGPLPLVLTGSGPTAGALGVTTGGVTGTLTAARYLEKYLDPRLKADAKAALDQLNSATDAENSLLKLMQAATEALQNCCQ